MAWRIDEAAELPRDRETNERERVVIEGGGWGGGITLRAEGTKLLFFSFFEKQI